MSKINFKKQKGFALLFSVLVSTIIISIGATIISISIRQTILSGTARESQVAFYAANTALECAFFWDTVKFALPTTGVVFPVGATEQLVSTPDQIKCAGGNIIDGSGFDPGPFSVPWTSSGPGTNNTSKTFKMVLENKATSGTDDLTTATTCATVTVSKELITADDGSTPEDESGRVTTRIEAKGYNICDTDSPRTVERGLELEYQN